MFGLHKDKIAETFMELKFQLLRAWARNTFVVTDKEKIPNVTKYILVDCLVKQRNLDSETCFSTTEFVISTFLDEYTSSVFRHQM